MEVVIPGRREASSPESIGPPTPPIDGFRVRATRAPECQSQSFRNTIDAIQPVISAMAAVARP
ncbi:hypothetical protein AB7M42_008437 [Bradyrhizobium diazoefficiens]|nr:hypothetical protein [Bradyrhizobium japonicum]